jgi:hypothetical protein
MRIFVSAVCFVALTACASQSPESSSASPTGETSEQLSASTASTPALDVLKKGGTFVFALDESSPSKRIHDQCSAQSGGDAAKADACYALVHDEGGREGIRFSTGPDGQLVWTSYASEDGKEVVLIEQPFAVTTDGDHVVVGRLVGTGRGRQAGAGVFAPNKLLRFEVPDATTVAMIDPDKGRLVFHRAP